MSVSPKSAFSPRIQGHYEPGPALRALSAAKDAAGLKHSPKARLMDAVNDLWPRPAKGKYRVIKVRCTKAYAPLVHGRTYYAIEAFKPNVPCRYAGSLLVSVDPANLGAHCIEVSRNCFEPLNPANLGLFPHLFRS